jgi:hypothetical protein
MHNDAAVAEHAPALLSAADVAKRLGISTRSVFNIIGLERVELPATGRKPIVRFTEQSVNHLISTRTRRVGV